MKSSDWEVEEASQLSYTLALLYDFIDVEEKGGEIIALC